MSRNNLVPLWISQEDKLLLAKEIIPLIRERYPELKEVTITQRIAINILIKYATDMKLVKHIF